MVLETPKRGRPSKDSLVAKQEEGKNTIADIQCKYCYRVFPRKKSLQTHEITHTGIKPYKCDYPHCSASFSQPNNFRFHTYVHTGEKPYACPATGCTVRFTHSSRTCPDHPFQKLIRDGNHKIRAHLWIRSREERNWLERYKKKTSAKVAKVCNWKKSSQASNRKRKISIQSAQSDEYSLQMISPLKTSTPMPVNSYKYNGYRSCSNYEPSTPEHNKPSEEMNINVNSLAQPQKSTYTVEEETAALVLMQLKNGAYRNNPPCNQNG